MTKSSWPKRPSPPKGEPLLSEGLRYWVEMQFGDRWTNPKFLKKRLEQGPDERIGTYHGTLIHLELDKTTNLLTVETIFVPEIEPEVVDYEEFKAFLRRERP